jgi:hypothetical protein
MHANLEKEATTLICILRNKTQRGSGCVFVGGWVYTPNLGKQAAPLTPLKSPKKQFIFIFFLDARLFL